MAKPGGGMLSTECRSSLILIFTLNSFLSSLLFLPAFITMIVLSSLRIARGTTSAATRPPPAAGLAGLPSLFGVCVYSFMCHHSLPSLVTPVSRKRHLVLLSSAVFTLVLTFYALLCCTAAFAFTPATLYDLYSLNFLADCSLPLTIRYLLGLFPVFTISTNFPIIAVTLRNNLRVIFLREGATFPWAIDRLVFPLLAVLPPVLVAFLTHDLEWLVGVTGAYAGAGIQYITPALLALCSRTSSPGSGSPCSPSAIAPSPGNPHRSPFAHRAWAYFVLTWALSCIILVTANIIITDTK
uniref:transmembrane protein 104-like n=1 Tax=Myxine glutinosa TaxID=7769 RepID=UPI00358F3156